MNCRARPETGGENMRTLNDQEWLGFRVAVKCRWLYCTHGQGLAGHGCCAAQGEWNRVDCPEFVLEEDYLAAWEKSESVRKREKGKG